MKTAEILPVRMEGEQLWILDQTRLPNEKTEIEIKTKEDLYDAIYHLKVRGAPAIGVAAAYGFYTAARDLKARSWSDFYRGCRETADYLTAARPTAVNLSWALKRMINRISHINDSSVRRQDPGETGGSGAAESAAERFLPDAPFDAPFSEEIRQRVLRILRQEADAICREDEEACRAMGEYGLSLLTPGMGILTHCNAGALAASRYGTCLAPVYLGQERGYGFRVFADETRPLLQGARLTAWELKEAGVDVTLICDNMASVVMKKGWIDAVVVGCDRMAANGDGANKIGTAGVAVLAKEYGIPFYMYVPASTIDLSCPEGKDIRIEERDGREISRMWYEKPMAPEGIRFFNPAFDVTEARYITAVITEKGIVRPPFGPGLRQVAEEAGRNRKTAEEG